VQTSVGRVFEFFNNYQFQVFEKNQNQNQRTTGCGYLKQFGIKEPPESGYVKKNQNQRTAGSGYFKNLKEPPGFVKEPANIFQFVGSHLIFQKFENHGDT